MQFIIQLIRSFAILFLICLSLSLLTACGSGGNSTLQPPPPPPPTGTVNSPVGPTDISAKIDRFVAFTELANLIRYYYPGDEAANTDWDTFLIAGMKKINETELSVSFESVLSELFSPIAPSLAINGKYLGSPQPANLRQVTYWNHRGFAFGASSHSLFGGLYQNNRVTESVSSPGQFFPKYQIHEQTLRTMDLVSFPIYIANENGKTQPSANGFSIDESEHILNRSYGDLYVRLAAVAHSWGVIKHFYPYLQSLELDWDSYLADSLSEAALSKNFTETYDLLSRLFANLQDGHVWPYSENIPSPGYAPFRTDWIEGEAVVTDIWGDADGQIDIGYVLTEINGEPVAHILTQLGLRTSIGVSKKNSRLAYRLNEIFGASQSYTFLDNNSQELEISFSATGYDERAVLWNRPQGKPEIDLFEIEPGIFYFDAIEWNPSSIPESEVLSQLADAKGIILDIRGYPDFNENMDVLDKFCDNSPLAPNYPYLTPPWQVMIASQPNQVSPYFDLLSAWRLPSQRFPGAKISAIIGRNSQSASDTMAAILQNCANVTLVGEPTTGANGNITSFTVLPSSEVADFSITFSGMEVFQNDGTRLLGIGVQPDVPVTLTRQGVIDGRDESLEQAIELVR